MRELQETCNFHVVVTSQYKKYRTKIIVSLRGISDFNFGKFEVIQTFLISFIIEGQYRFIF
jgi:hypothetical protein